MAKTQSGLGFTFAIKMNFKWGIFRWHFCYIGGYGHNILHDVTKLHLADSTITSYSIRAFPSKFKKYLRLNITFVILYFVIY